MNNKKLKKNSTVYLTAFLKSNKNRFYMCKAYVEKQPENDNTKQMYKVKIFSVADRAVGTKEFVVHQTTLLGRTITKDISELHVELQDFLRPMGWIELIPSE